MPLVTATHHVLPLDRLSPLEFERMCLWLVWREGFERAEHLGMSGSESGRDIVAFREGRRYAFQCKRVQRLARKAAVGEIARLLSLSDEERPDAIVFVASCPVSANVRAAARRAWGREDTCHFWTATELDEKIKRHPDILEEFFSIRSKTPRAPGVPALPRGYVPRDAKQSEIRTLLLGDSGRGVTGAVVALSGQGGFGKSMLALAVCHDEAVRRAFGDRIFWVTLGQQADVAAAIAGLYARITGTPRRFATVEDGALSLVGALEDHPSLLVVDDVWDEADLRPFLDGSKNCTRLVTTRSLPVSTQHAHVAVDVMELHEALALVREVSPGREDLASIRTVVDRLGRWPLLLDLARGVLRRRISQGESLKRALLYLEHAVATKGPTAFDTREPKDRRQAFEATIGASLSQLTEESRLRLFEIAIFKPDTGIPIAALRALWGLPTLFAAEDLAQQFADLALVRVELGERAMLALHTNLHHYFAEQLGNAVSVHARLCAGWGDGGVLPDEFAARWIGYHLLQAGQADLLRRLLMLPAWVLARLNAVGVAPVIADCVAMSSDSAMHLLASALRLSATALSADPTQLSGQIFGRLFRDPELQDAYGTSQRTWLKSRFPSMQQAGSALVARASCQAGTVACSFDASVIVLGGHPVTVWNINAPDAIRELQSNTSPYWWDAISVSLDGSSIFVASVDGKPCEWSSASKDATTVLTDETALAVTLSHDDRYLAIALASGDLRVSDRQTGAIIFSQHRSQKMHRIELVGTGEDLLLIAGWHHDGSVILAELDVWSIATGKLVTTLRPEDEDVCICGFTRCGPSQSIVVALVPVVSNMNDSVLEQWQLIGGERRQFLETWDNGTKEFCPLSVSHDGRLFAAPTGSGVVSLWKLHDGQDPLLLCSERRLHSDSFLDLVLSGDGEHLIVVTEDGHVMAWSVRTLIDEPVDELSTDNAEDSEQFFSLARGTQTSLMGHLVWVNRVAASVLSPTLLSIRRARRKWNVCVWDTTTARKRGAFDGHDSQVIDVLVCDRGESALSCEADGTILYWDIASLAVKATLTGHTSAVTALAAEFDRGIAVSGSADGSVRTWNLLTGQPRRELQKPGGKSVWSVAMSNDSRRGPLLLAGFGNGAVKCWNDDGSLAWPETEARSGSVSNVCFGPIEGEIVSVRSGVIEQLDGGSGTLKRSIDGSRGVLAITSIRGTSCVCTVNSHQEVQIWDLEDGTLVCGMRCDGDLRDCDAVVTANGTFVAVGEETGPIHFFELWRSDS